MKTKILVTGSNGMLGKEIVEKLSQDAEAEVVGVDKQDFDITDKKNTQKYIDKICPDFIIHTAAYTNVDKAEQEREACFLVNETGSLNLVQAGDSCGAVFCYISTDFVFDGVKNNPYLETDKPNPINVYGFSKYKGEQAVSNTTDKYFILRTSWLYGKHGKNFIDTIINLAKTRQELDIVSDQIGSPTYAQDIAENIMHILNTKKFGIYNITGRGQ
ncbi:dTDP-4-dehydrorhamnose reductase, partial [bacterium]|nr:dTDP-4-dehydrorhamnose reductase [bacterium]